MAHKSLGRKCFDLLNYVILALASLSCVLPLIHVLALSFSSTTAVNGGYVVLWPVDFTTKSYEFLVKDGKFFASMLNSIKRVILGVTVNIILLILTAYPLSKPKEKLAGRNIYMAYFVITMLVSGGMIPLYLVVAKLKMIDSVWSLILPGSLSVYNMLILMNFIRSMPEELEEAAFVDGASPIQTLLRVLLPILRPAIATVTLFSVVNHWNSWFDGVIYMNSTAKYPLQIYLRTVLQDFEAILRRAGSDYTQLIAFLNVRSGRAAQIFLAALPIMMVYPFLQKYFTKGLVLGSVKG